MSDVISLADARAKRAPAAPPVQTRQRRGLGVLIAGPRAKAAMGVLGGNISIMLPSEAVFCDLNSLTKKSKKFDLNEFGVRIRAERGIKLDLDEVVQPEPPQPPSPLIA